MNFRARVYKPALLMLAALLFCVAGQMQTRLNIARKGLGLTKVEPLQNAPPVLAFTTVALGGFRGLIANALWIRLSKLQEDDKYFEMVQLADWITKLQPRMVPVWIFQAWNMSYNISVKFKNPEDRWHWVKRGIELLRDDALKYNPNETLIYRELSWHFQHKMGQNLDDAHRTYKLRWAQEMQDVLGGRPNFEELKKASSPEYRGPTVSDPGAPNWRERARKLREVYKMDPEMVEKVDKDYGPFDWRLPDAHAVYWAEMGRLSGRPEDQETLRRSIYQSLQGMMFRGGSLDTNVTTVTDDNFFLWPNLDQVPTINNWYEKMLAEEKITPNGLQKNIENAHKNFLKQAIYMLYENGRESEAQHWFDHVKQLYTNAFQMEGTNITLRDYAVSQILTDNDETDANKVKASILGMLEAKWVWYGRDLDDRAANYDNLAKLIRNHYERKTDGLGNDRLKLESMQQLNQFVLDRLLDPNAPPGVRRLAARLRTRLNLPPPKPRGTAEPAAPAAESGAAAPAQAP